MRAARASETFPGSVHEAEKLWCDTSRWHMWVDGLERVLSVEGDWPSPGATVRWESTPAGRGHVTERVVAYEQLRGLSTEVVDGSITGRQTVTFTAVRGGVAVELALEYELLRGGWVGFLSVVVDPLFIRRAMATSLASTLGRFGAELAERHSAGEP
jgi:Polyketide cyclase / dehydrase and lipid transport